MSENANFAEAVEAAGLTFVGPRAETIRQMGDKATARDTAARAGVATVPGSEGRIVDIEEARKLAGGIGFPIMIKAAAGGGGRGIHIARSPDELEQLIPQASGEATAAFGDGGLYLERFIERARHIEVQILGDGERAVHVYERECSIQRRRQKVWEEAPAACLAPDIREKLCASAVALARAVGYRGAGTLEFLYDEETGEFFFIEMNTRIQVEHPVTEMVTGIDLVKEMINIAGGNPLSFAQSDVRLRGHAIECRINAENPAKGFLPSPGAVTSLARAGGRARPLRYHAVRRLRGAAVLRFPAWQADRLGRKPRRGARTHGGGLGQAQGGRDRHHHCRCMWRWPTIPKWPRTRFTPGGWRRGWKETRSPRRRR